MSENNNKKNGLLNVLKGIGAVVGTIALAIGAGEAAHKGSAANSRKKAMDAALKENNKNK